MDLVNARLRKYIPISPMTQTTLKTTIQHSEINFGFFPLAPTIYYIRENRRSQSE